MKPTAKKQSAKPDAELLRVLNEWDDKEADALTASKTRLDALGPDAVDRVQALLGRVLIHYRTANLIVGGGIALIFLLALVGSLLLPSHQPAPDWFSASLLGIIGLIIGAAVVCLTRIPSRVACNATSVISCFPPAKGLRLLLRLYTAGQGQNKQRAREYKALRVVLEKVSASDAGCLDASDLRRLRSLTISFYGTLACAAIRALIVLDDGSALPRIRRMAKYSKDWEIQEATHDYLARFAPAETIEIGKSGVALKQNGPVTQTDTADVNPVLACVMQLGSWETMERRTAETTLRQMGPEPMRQVLLLLGQEPAAERRNGRAIIGVSMLLISLTNALWFPLALRLPYFDASMARSVTGVMMAAGLPIGWIIGLEVTSRRRNRRRARQLGCRVGLFPGRRLLNTLETLDNPALVGTLVDALPDATAELSSLTDLLETNRSLRIALTHLLPCLQASDANLLNATQRARLNHELARGRQALSTGWTTATRVEVQAALDVAILKAWEQIGDEHALPVVQKLAAQTARTPAQKRVQQAAQSCLPYLEVRAGEQRAVQTLLRAAETPTESGNVLLRAAASGNTQPDAAQLLRANAGEE